MASTIIVSDRGVSIKLDSVALLAIKARQNMTDDQLADMLQSVINQILDGKTQISISTDSAGDFTLQLLTLF